MRPICLIWKRKFECIKSRHRKTFGRVHFLEARNQLYKCYKPQETIWTNIFTVTEILVNKLYI